MLVSANTQTQTFCRLAGGLFDCMFAAVESTAISVEMEFLSARAFAYIYGLAGTIFLWLPLRCSRIHCGSERSRIDRSGLRGIATAIHTARKSNDKKQESSLPF